MQHPITLFSNTQSPVPYKTLDLPQLVTLIKSDGMRTRISKIRESTSQSDKKWLKNQLPCFCSGEFSYRNNASLIAPSCLLVFDFDTAKSPETSCELKNRAKSVPFIACAFASPTYGVKLVCRTNLRTLNPTTYKACYKALARHLESVLDIELDNTCDISRACNLSYDPDVYFNQNASEYQFSDEQREETEIDENVDTASSRYHDTHTINRRVQSALVERVVRRYKGLQSKGNRHDLVFKLTMSLYQYGLMKNEVIRVLRALGGLYTEQQNIEDYAIAQEQLFNKQGKPYFEGIYERDSF